MYYLFKLFWLKVIFLIDVILS